MSKKMNKVATANSVAYVGSHEAVCRLVQALKDIESSGLEDIDISYHDLEACKNVLNRICRQREMRNQIPQVEFLGEKFEDMCFCIGVNIAKNLPSLDSDGGDLAIGMLTPCINKLKALYRSGEKISDLLLEAESMCTNDLLGLHFAYADVLVRHAIEFAKVDDEEEEEAVA